MLHRRRLLRDPAQFHLIQLRQHGTCAPFQRLPHRRNAFWGGGSRWCVARRRLWMRLRRVVADGTPPDCRSLPQWRQRKALLRAHMDMVFAMFLQPGKVDLGQNQARVPLQSVPYG